MGLRGAEPLPRSWGQERGLRRRWSGECTKLGVQDGAFLPPERGTASLGLCFPLFNSSEPGVPLPLSVTDRINKEETRTRGIPLRSGSQTVVHIRSPTLLSEPQGPKPRDSCVIRLSLTGGLQKALRPKGFSSEGPSGPGRRGDLVAETLGSRQRRAVDQNCIP